MLDVGPVRRRDRHGRAGRHAFSRTVVTPTAARIDRRPASRHRPRRSRSSGRGGATEPPSCQAEHELRMNSGPRPSAGRNGRSNSASPSSNRATSSRPSPSIGTSEVLTSVLPASGVGASDELHAVAATRSTMILGLTETLKITFTFITKSSASRHGSRPLPHFFAPRPSCVVTMFKRSILVLLVVVGCGRQRRV